MQDSRTKSVTADLAWCYDELAEVQRKQTYCEIRIRFEAGRAVLFEATEVRKPPVKVPGRIAVKMEDL